MFFLLNGDKQLQHKTYPYLPHNMFLSNPWCAWWIWSLDLSKPWRLWRVEVGWGRSPIRFPSSIGTVVDFLLFLRIKWQTSIIQSVFLGGSVFPQPILIAGFWIQLFIIPSNEASIIYISSYFRGSDRCFLEARSALFFQIIFLMFNTSASATHQLSSNQTVFNHQLMNLVCKKILHSIEAHQHAHHQTLVPVKHWLTFHIFWFVLAPIRVGLPDRSWQQLQILYIVSAGQWWVLPPSNRINFSN